MSPFSRNALASRSICLSILSARRTLQVLQMFVSKFVKKQSKGDRPAKSSASTTKSSVKVQRTSETRKQLVRIHHATDCPKDGRTCRIGEHWHLAARCGASVPYIWHFSAATASVVSYNGRCKHPRCDNICRLVRETIRRSEYNLCKEADCQVCRGVREKMGQTKSSGVWV